MEKQDWDISTILAADSIEGDGPPSFPDIERIAAEIAAFRNALRAQRFTERDVRGMTRYFAMNLLASCIHSEED